MESSNLNMLIWIAQKLGGLRQDVVFLGGAITELLITDPIPPIPQPTKDVNAIIEVTTRVEYQRLGKQLRELGFQEDMTPKAPLCRWRIEDFVFDVMPTNEEILGFTNTWYKAAIQTSQNRVLTQHLEIRLIRAPYFIATKLEAFFSRGNQDYLMSHDLEDILMVLNGRAEIESEFLSSDHEVRQFVANSIQELLARQAFVDAIPGHLPMNDRTDIREKELLQRLFRLARMT